MIDNSGDFSHPVLNETIRSIGGEYRFNTERRAIGKNGEFLYFSGYFMVDRSCCGVAGSAYALVAGYIVKWKYRTGEDGRFVSLVRPVKNLRDRADITAIIKKEDAMCQVTFL
jgi:hypothetical protein